MNKKLLLIILLWASACRVYAQISFNRTYDREVLINTNEGALIENNHGYLSSNLVWRPNYFGKLWLMQVSFIGDTLWNVSFGDSANGDNFGSRALAIASDSIYYFLGGSNGSYISFSDSGMLLKIDTSGAVLWASKVKFAPRSTTGWNMIKSSKEELVMVGNNYDFHPLYQFINIGACAYAFDTSGNLLWNQSYTNGIGEQKLWQLVETPDKGFMMCGWTYLGPSGNNADFWVIRTDSAGNVIWENFYGGAGNQGGLGITKLSDGNYLLCGERVNQNYGKGRIIKIDINGNVIWQRTFNTSLVNKSEWIWRTLELPSGEIITIGNSENNPSGYESGWLMKLDSAGNKIWERYFVHISGDNYIDNFNTGILTSDGGILLAGFASPDSTVFNPPFLAPSDVWLVKLDSSFCDSTGCPVFTGIPANPYVNAINVFAYPNPFSEQPVIIKIPGIKNGGQVWFEIMDVLGKNVKSGKVIAETNDYLMIDRRHTSELATGIYFVRLKTNKGIYSAKVIKE